MWKWLCDLVFNLCAVGSWNRVAKWILIIRKKSSSRASGGWEMWFAGKNSKLISCRKFTDDKRVKSCCRTSSSGQHAKSKLRRTFSSARREKFICKIFFSVQHEKSTCRIFSSVQHGKLGSKRTFFNKISENAQRPSKITAKECCKLTW